MTIFREVIEDSKLQRSNNSKYFFFLTHVDDASCDQNKILKVNTVVRADVSTDQPYARNL